MKKIMIKIMMNNDKNNEKWKEIMDGNTEKRIFP